MDAVKPSTSPSPSRAAGSALVTASSTRPRDGGGEPNAPAVTGRLRRWSHRAKKSVWAPIVAKAATVFAGMLALAAVGATSTFGGSVVPEKTPPAEPKQASLGGVWMPEPAPAAADSEKPATPPAERGPQPAPSAAPSSSGAPAEAPPEKPAGITPDGKVILNTASAEDFDRLPGVGRSRAEAIVALRTRLGRFRKPTDLLRVRGIGVRSLKKMLPHLVLDPPAEPKVAEEGREEDRDQRAR